MGKGSVSPRLRFLIIKLRNYKRQLLFFNTADKPGSDDVELYDSDR